MPRLTARSLAVRRGPTRVVEGLDLVVGPGSVYWIVGPNGAGKSSLLRVLAGLDPAASGEVVREAPSGSRFLYYHTEMALPPWSVVAAWDRLVSGLAPALGAPTAVRPELGAGRWIRRLSTGERKRLLLDVLLRLPGSLLLDEPYEHLSPDAKAVLSARIRERAATAVVVVVTNQAEHRWPGEPGIRLEAGRFQPLAETSGPPGTGVSGGVVDRDPGRGGGERRGSRR